MVQTRAGKPQITDDGKYIIGKNGQLVPIARSFRRDPRWDTETWEPAIEAVEGYDLMKVLRQDDDDYWLISSADEPQEEE